jgi:hypothetical protein
MQDGHAYGHRPKHGGEFILTTGPDNEPKLDVVECGFVSSDPVWANFDCPITPSPNQKGRLEQISRSGRTLRSPTFRINTGTVFCRVRGPGHVVACVDSHRLVAGPLHGETVLKIDEPGSNPQDDGWRWVQLNLDRYRGHDAHLEFTPAVGATLDVQMAVEEDPARTFTRPEGALTLGSFRIDSILDKWLKGEVLELRESRTVKAALLYSMNLPNRRDEFRSILNDWARERRDIQEGISRSGALAPAMLDGTGEDDRLLIRGNSSTPGDVVPRRFLEAIDGPAPMKIAAGSGRLELARHITDRGNPLTNRVIVNRLWHHLMGRGIVPTTDDFGVLGQRPTHPELLDHLATEFQKDGQSLKRMIRRIVLSQTYRISGQVDPATKEADPKNELWHHRPPKRLEGEAVRDSLLAVSGRLDRSAFGPSVKVHLTSFMEGRGRPPQSGPQDGANRRSVYLEVRRNFLSPFLLTFDTPNPFSAMGRRNVSNVPAQALILMNDPFVRQCAESWASRGATEAPADPGERITWFYRHAFGRRPTEQETKLLREFLTTGDSKEAKGAAWTDLAHALINAKEFIYIP